MKKKIIIVMMVFLLMLGCLPQSTFATTAKTAVKQEHRNKISDVLQEKMKNKEAYYDVIVVFKENADTKKALKEAKSVKSDQPQALKDREAVIGEMKETALKTQQDIIKWLESEKKSGNVKKYNSYFIINALHLVAKEPVIKKIASMDKVESVDFNESIRNEVPIIPPSPQTNRIKRRTNEIEWNIRAIHANDVWEKYKITGEGVTVGILDSAVDVTHPALRNKFRGYDPKKQAYHYPGNFFDGLDSNLSYSTTMNSTHGSHCMGIILGDQTDTKGNKYNQIGVAPGAKFICARVFGNNNESSVNGFLSSAQWMLAPGGEAAKAPQVINNSWGGGINTDKFFEKSVNAWSDAGIFPVFSAGNKLPREQDPGPESIAAPANLEKSFAVGSVDKNFNLSWFSKRGPSPHKDVTGIKPEISAPGETIRSTVGGGNFMYMSGTSMAAPHVTGVVALLKQAKPNMTVNEMRKILEDTAVPATDTGSYTSSPNYGFGYGVVNAYTAVSAVENVGVGKVRGKITADSKTTDAQVYIKETNISVNANASDGAYAMNHPAGKYTLCVSKYGYETQEKSINIQKGKDQTIDFSLIKKGVGEIKGKVVNKEGKPIDGVFVRVLQNNKIQPIQTNAQGEFSFKEIPYDQYTLRVFKSEMKAIEVSANLTQSVLSLPEIKLEINEDDKELTISHHTGDVPNLDLDQNYPVGPGGYEGGAVMFAPTKKGSKLKSVEIQFANQNAYYSGSKAKLMVLNRDDRGRVEELIEPIVFDFVPGKKKTISLEEFGIQVERPFYVVVKTPDRHADKFLIGTIANGDQDYSYLYSDGNVFPMGDDFSYGALMMRAVISHPKDAADYKITVEKPQLDEVREGNRTITGKGKAYETIQISLGSGSSYRTRTNDKGIFKIEIDRKLVAGEEVTAYARDTNGIKSEGASRFALNDYSILQEKITIANGQIPVGSTDTKYEPLKELIDEGNTLINAIKADEQAGKVTKERILQYKKDINKKIQELKQGIIDLSGDKKELLTTIKKAEQKLQDIWTSQTGSEVPATKQWAKEYEKQTLRLSILNAKAIYARIDAQKPEINAVKDKLETAIQVFQNAAKKGLKEIISPITAEKFKNGTFEGEGRGYEIVASHIQVTIKDGKITEIKITDWNESEDSKTVIQNDGYLNRIIKENALDVAYTKGYEKQCEGIVNAIIQALGKALKEKESLSPDLALLMEKVESAKDNLQKYKPSSDGKKLDDGILIVSDTKWAEKDSYIDLQKALADTEKRIKDGIKTIDARNKAVTLLEIALRNFENSIHTGPTTGKEDEKQMKDGSYKVATVGHHAPKKNEFTVLIKNGKVESIQIDKWVDSSESEYGPIKTVKGTFLDQFKGRGDHNVEAISGATNSSKSIKNAVKEAFEQARKAVEKENTDNEKVLKEKIGGQIFKAKEALYQAKMAGKYHYDTTVQTYIDAVNDIASKNTSGTIAKDALQRLEKMIEDFKTTFIK